MKARSHAPRVAPRSAARLRKVEPADVRYVGFTASVSCKRKLMRQSRALDDREYRLTFEHVPTGRQVVIETGLVHWSRKETRQQIEALRISKAVELLEKPR